MANLSTSERDRLCCEAISTYLFDKIWNEPVSEYRQNFKLLLLKKKSVIGNFSLNGNIVDLPTVDTPYYLWLLDTDTVNIEAECPTDTWFSLKEINDQYRILINVYGDDGGVFNKATTFVMYNKAKTGLFVAARKRMVNKTIAYGAIDNVYATFYYDSDIPDDVEICSLAADSYRRLDEYSKELLSFLETADNKDQVLMFCNGVEVTDVQNPPSVGTGNYYDFIIDRNIKFAFDVDVTNTSQDPVYLSTEDKLWKQLIHIPKALNPTNKIFTHNTCDFYVRSYSSENVKGKYLHRVHAHAVTQVTHNDFGISLDVLDAYRDYLADQLLTIHVVCRQHDKDNVLIRNACYIDLLYCDYHSDDDIINILCGKGPKDIPWWTAPVTEQSKYVEFMFDTPNGQIATQPAKVMQDFVDAIGIDSVMNQICHRIHDFNITDAFDGSLIVATPVMYTGKSVIAAVYLNGILIDNDYINISYSTDGSLNIKFDDVLVLKPGDKICVIEYITGLNATYKFTPTSKGRSIAAPCENFTVWRAVQTRTGEPAEGVQYSSTTVYEKIAVGTNVYVVISDDNGNQTITFNELYDDEVFYIQNTEAVYRYKEELDTYTENGKSIAIPLKCSVAGTNDRIPIFEITNLSVFINGRYLVRGIDYVLNKVVDSDDKIACYEVVVQTMDYFSREADPDIFEVIVHVAQSEDSSCGFSVNNLIYDETPVNTYFSNISTLFINGKLNRDIGYDGVKGVLPPGEYPEGSIWEIQTCLPVFIREFVETYSTSEDRQRIAIMNTYFEKFNPTMPSPYILSSKHRIYSVMMNNFINDFLDGKIVATEDPDQTRMDALIKPYLYLKDVDLVFTGENQTFVDYYPQYTTREVTTSQRRIIEKFIKAYMPANSNPTDETVYGD